MAATRVVNGRPPPKTMPVAIIGISCTLSGKITTPEELWSLVSQSKSTWSAVPKNRFNSDGFYNPTFTSQGTHHVRGAHFIQEDIGLFDASFFNLTVEAAASMDPQIRLQLESVFEAFENAGLPLEGLAGSDTAVFSGQFVRDYSDALMRDPDTLPRFYLSGNGAAMMSARIAHFFDLRGPCMTLDTGCSTGLTVLHLACQSIRNLESKIAVVSGSNLLLNPENFNQMATTGFLSTEGRSFSFDSRGTGYGRGEGVATIIVKSLDDAIKDKDPIRAIIRETCLNQDGNTPTITSPSMDAQADLIRRCYEKAGLDPMDTVFIEAHGTGTSVGDPTEAKAIYRAIGGNRPRDQPLLIGSVKSNIGHCEATSALAGIIKVIMAFEKGHIPPNHDFQSPNPRISFSQLNMKVPTSLMSWPSGGPRRASLNSFGYGGTNGHAILEAADSYFPQNVSMADNTTSKSWRVFTLSAKDANSLTRMILKHREYLGCSSTSNEQKLLSDLAYTLGQRRSNFGWKAAVTARDTQGLIAALDGISLPTQRKHDKLRLGFVFTGQGSQWHAMGRELIQAYSVFKETVVEADNILRQFGCQWSAMEELMKQAASSRVSEVEIGICLCTVVQISLVRLLASWGIHPDAVTGHSSGEAAAVFAAGAVSMTEALAISWKKGNLIEKFGKKPRKEGSMLVVGLGVEQVKPFLDGIESGNATVACVNSPCSVTLSGDSCAIDELENKITHSGIFVRRLPVKAAFHSHHMRAFASPYLAHLRSTLSQSGSLSNTVFSSSTTGNLVTDARELGPDYWVKNMTQTVLFSDAFANMCLQADSTQEDPKVAIDLVVEVGPHGGLASPIRQIVGAPTFNRLEVPYETCLSRGQDAVMTMQKLASLLISRGYAVNVAAVNSIIGSSSPSTLTDLPSYPWNHQTRYWMEPRINRQYRLREHTRSDLIGFRVPGMHPDTPVWRNIVRLQDMPWLKDHCFESTAIFPAAGYICMAVEALGQLSTPNDGTASDVYLLRDMIIERGLMIPSTSEGIEVQIRFRSHKNDNRIGSESWREFHISSVTITTDEWTEHCHGYIAAPGRSENHWSPSKDTWAHGDIKNASKMDPSVLFERLRRLGLQHGPAFENVTDIQTGDMQSIVRFRAGVLPNDENSVRALISPMNLDSIILSAFTALKGFKSGHDRAMLPCRFGSITIYADTLPPLPHEHQFQTHNIVSTPGPDAFFSSSVTLRETSECQLAPFVEIKDLEFSAFGSSLHDDEASTAFCSTIQWADDLSYMDSEALSNYVTGRNAQQEIKLLNDSQLIASCFIHNALYEIKAVDITGLDDERREFVDWMIQQRDSSDSANQSQTQRRDELLFCRDKATVLKEKVMRSSPMGMMLCQIGENIVPWIRGRTDVTEHMNEAESLRSCFDEAVSAFISYQYLRTYLELYTHKYPRANILEISTGRLGCTKTVLDAISPGKSTKRAAFNQYDFTDASEERLGRSRAMLSSWEGRLSFKKLDITIDPILQAFQAETYDLIISCASCREGENMDTSLMNMRKLLKSEGTLLLIDQMANSVTRQDPVSNIPNWHNLLQRTGFSGVVLNGSPQLSHPYPPSSTLMVTTALDKELATYDQSVVLAYSSSVPPQAWILALSQKITEATGANVEVSRLPLPTTQGKMVIFLEMIHPELADMATETYDAIKDMLLRSKGVLWVTRGASIECAQPLHSLSHGLLRVLRCENPSSRYVTLDLDHSRPHWTPEDIRIISSIYENSFNMAPQQSLLDLEYSERNGLIKVPRLVEISPHDGSASMLTADSGYEMQPFHQHGKEARLNGDGESLRDMTFDVHVADDDQLPSDSIQIVPRAFNMHFDGPADRLTSTYGVAGLVDKVGKSVTTLMKGQRVCAMVDGLPCSRIQVSSLLAVPIPEGLEMEVAATIPMIFSPVFSALHDSARIQPGESILIHDAAGDVGQAAVRLASAAGARIIATVLSSDDLRFVADTLGVSEYHVLLGHDATWASRVMMLTRGKGVDIVLSQPSEENIRKSWECMSPLGRFCQVGHSDVLMSGGVDMSPLARMTSYNTIELPQVAQHKPQQMHRIMTATVDLVATHSTLHSISIPTTSISALDAVVPRSSSHHSSSIIAVASEGDKVKARSTPKQKTASGDAGEPDLTSLPPGSYLVVGGLGGIGQSICQRLATQGAECIIIISRAAEQKMVGLQDFRQRIEEQGCHLYVQNCDITSEKMLGQVLHDTERLVPPIVGVIHASMVLRDELLNKMGLADFNAALHPKTNGAWNLHNYFANHSLKFFVLLSSIAGVAGNIGQANYAAGGAFEDALSRYRSSKGLPSVTIDLGAVKEIGYLAQHERLAQHFQSTGHKMLSQVEVLDLIDDTVRNPYRTLDKAQVVTGIDRHSAWKHSPWARDARFATLQPPQSISQSPDAVHESVRPRLKKELQHVQSPDEAGEKIVSALKYKVANMFSVTTDDINLATPLSEYGVDSLTGTELKDWVSDSMGAHVSIFEVTQNVSLASLARTILGKLGG